MTTNRKISHAALPLAIVAATLSAGHTAPAHAQELVGEGTNAGEQCTTSGINNGGKAVGTCIPANGTGPAVPWVDEAFNDGIEVALPPLSRGQSCSTGGDANNGTIIGECLNASGVAFAVTWNAASPTTGPVKLTPVSGLLGLDPDVSTAATAYDQIGYVVGESYNTTAVGTPVLYAPGSGTAVELTSYGSNCVPVDITDTLVNGMPEVAINCPNANGTVTPEVATATGLLGAYVTSNLPLPSGSTYCSVTAIDNTDQLLGTCHTPGPDVPQTAFWPNATTAPTLLVVTIGGSTARNAGDLLNNSGNAVVEYRQPGTGIDLPALWNPTTGNLTFIPPLPGGAHVTATCLADNNVVGLASEDSAENTEAAYWSPSGGLVAEGFVNDGEVSVVTGCSQNGAYLAATGEGDGENSLAEEGQISTP